METGLPRPILPIGALREVREIIDRSGVAGPPVEIMPLPEGDFKHSDMTAELLKDPRLLHRDTFEKSGDEDELPPAPNAKPEEEDAAYQLELGAKQTVAKAKSQALETMLAYERLGRGLRRVSPAPRPPVEGGGGREPVSAPRPMPGGEQGIPAGLLEEPPADSLPTDNRIALSMPDGAVETALQETLPQDAPQQVTQGASPGDIPPSEAMITPESDAVVPDPSPDAAADTAYPLSQPDAPNPPPPNVPPPRGRAHAEPKSQAEVPPATQEQGGGDRRVSARIFEAQSTAARAVEAQSGAPESRGALENLQKFAKLPFYLYLFGGEMPRYTDEEGARAIPSRRKRRAEPDWTMESLTMADAVRLAAVLHNVYFGGDGAFDSAEPWYMPFLRYTLEQGILYAGEFGTPEDPVTRAHFADILARCVPDAALPVINPLTTVSDVKEGVGYGSGALKMVRAGIFAPVGPLALFDPERLVTRREAAVYVGRILTPSDRRRF